MTAPTPRPWEGSLRDRARRVYAAARFRPGTWQEELLPNDFQFGASVEPGTGALEFRFRCLAGGRMSKPEFALECERLAAYLGSGEWDFEPADVGLWWEMSVMPRNQA